MKRSYLRIVIDTITDPEGVRILMKQTDQVTDEERG